MSKPGPHNPEMSWHVWCLHAEALRLQALMYRIAIEAPKEPKP
jgi:hypothetical protein